jgi:site-specific recombinase XerD
MVESGIRLEIIQKILGHSDISTTRIYAKIYDQVVRDEMEKLTY